MNIPKPSAQTVKRIQDALITFLQRLLRGLWFLLRMLFIGLRWTIRKLRVGVILLRRTTSKANIIRKTDER
jgi:hypothetical protein